MTSGALCDLNVSIQVYWTAVVMGLFLAKEIRDSVMKRQYRDL